tara:strand:- start:1054 stop:1497 length:444 start_codon:yes stop_codon:yes gene_type:complete
MDFTLDISKKFNLKKIKLDLHRELNDAGAIIKKDHFNRLERGQGVTGPLKNLKDSTIASKGFDQILVNTGKMRNLILNRANKNKQEITLHPGRKQKRNGVTNEEIGLFHQTGAGKLPKREWFGITKESEAKCLKVIELKIERILKNA